MDDGVFEIECPCCGAALEVDAESGQILSHRKPEPSSSPADLSEAVKRLRSEESTRDARFRKQVEAERAHNQALDKRFDGLLKKARKEGPGPRVPRDIDLD